MKIMISPLVVSVASLIGCGGGSTPVTSTSSGLTPEAQSLACEQDYFKTIIGKYTGTAEYAPIDEVRCFWNISMEVVGTPVVAMCSLNAQTQADVTQLTYASEDSAIPYECLDDSGFRNVREPISLSLSSGLEIPNLGNEYFPIELQVDSNTTFDTGPYSLDESITANYLQVFDGAGRTLGNIVIVEGDGTITLRSRNGTFNGILLKEN